MRGLSLVVARGGHSSSQCVGLSLSRPLLLRSTGSRCAGSVVVAHGPSCSAACGIFPDQGSNLCPLHWQADSQPLCHQGSPQVLKSSSPQHSYQFTHSSKGNCCLVQRVTQTWAQTLLCWVNLHNKFVNLTELQYFYLITK